MRRSTAAAVGTLPGAALILGVRLSVAPADVPVATAPVSEEQDAGSGDAAAEPEPTATKKPAGKKTTPPAAADEEAEAPAAEEEPAEEEPAGPKAGTYKGKAAQNQYGAVQVTIKISGGKITAANATYPNDGFSGTINPKAVDKLSAATLKAQSAEVDAVSGATFTSQSYVQSLQAALDKAGA